MKKKLALLTSLVAFVVFFAICGHFSDITAKADDTILKLKNTTGYTITDVSITDQSKPLWSDDFLTDTICLDSDVIPTDTTALTIHATVDGQSVSRTFSDLQAKRFTGNDVTFYFEVEDSGNITITSNN